MKQNKPRGIKPTTAAGETAFEGLHQHGVTLEVTHNDETKMRADTDTLRKTNAEFQELVSLILLDLKAQEDASKKAAEFITITREMLKPKLGSRYSRAWNAAGFFNGNLAVGRTASERLEQVEGLQLYLTSHPEVEVPDFITAAIAGMVAADLKAAKTALGNADVARRKKKAERDAALSALGSRLGNLFQELKQLMPPDDPRWIDFGFNVPADVTAPAAPEIFSVTAGAPGHLVFDWERPTGAKRIRVFRQIVGVDAEFVHIGTFYESSKDLGGFTSGAHVKFHITAANAGGESLPSATVEVVVP